MAIDGLVPKGYDYTICGPYADCYVLLCGFPVCAMDVSCFHYLKNRLFNMLYRLSRNEAK